MPSSVTQRNAHRCQWLILATSNAISSGGGYTIDGEVNELLGVLLLRSLAVSHINHQLGFGHARLSPIHRSVKVESDDVRGVVTHHVICITHYDD